MRRDQSAVDPVMELARKVGRKVVIGEDGVRLETVELDEQSLRRFFRLLKEEEDSQQAPPQVETPSTPLSWGTKPGARHHALRRNREPNV